VELLRLLMLVTGATAEDGDVSDVDDVRGVVTNCTVERLVLFLLVVAQEVVVGTVTPTERHCDDNRAAAAS